jgi:hypothetical protein
MLGGAMQEPSLQRQGIDPGSTTNGIFKMLAFAALAGVITEFCRRRTL